MSAAAEAPPLNLIERAIAAISPSWAAHRARSRLVFAYYEAAKPDKYRKGRRERGSADAAVMRADTSLREQARHLEQNLDIARGVLDTLTSTVIGPAGINPEPQPRTATGEIHDELARQILRLYRDWTYRPEVTWQHDWPSAQRLAARTWFRDGECFAQFVEGAVPKLDHGTLVPLSLELLEPDFVPLDYEDVGRNVSQGVERNEWGRPRAFFVYRRHPGDVFRVVTRGDLKRIGAERMRHLRMVDRLHQTRGVSIFASVLGRLEDVKDYEESERIAAKVAASMAGYIKKGQPDEYAAPADGKPRELKFRPGMIFDDLLPGEEIGTIGTTRPNSNVDNHRRGQLRAVAAGTRVTYSSAAKDYDGTYSAQRQELVEGWGAYQILGAEFVSQLVHPVYERFIDLAILSGQLVVPPEVPIESVKDALWILPQMPWIDPKKEADAWGTLEDHNYASGPEIVRRRGQTPADVLDQQQHWEKMKRDRSLAAGASPAREAPPDEETDEQGRRRETRRRA